MQLDGPIPTVRTKILAYLGEMRTGEWVLATKLCFDLSLRFTSAKNALKQLEDQRIVVKRIESERGTVALYSIAPRATLQHFDQTLNDFVVRTFIPPEWNEIYGKHPHTP